MPGIGRPAGVDRAEDRFHCRVWEAQNPWKQWLVIRLIVHMIRLVFQETKAVQERTTGLPLGGGCATKGMAPQNLSGHLQSCPFPSHTNISDCPRFT